MSDPYKLRMAEDFAEGIRAHAGKTYPEECCGALFGKEEGPGRPREILGLYPLVNRREDSPRNRFSVTSRDVLDAEKAAAGQGLDVVGWYHSHPDHPARPSEYDREHAWPWYSYIIVSVQDRVPKEMTSWRLAEDRTCYTEESIEVQPAEREGN